MLPLDEASSSAREELIKYRQGLLAERGMSITDVANRSGLSRNTVNGIIHHGERCKLDTMMKVADALDLSSHSELYNGIAPLSDIESDIKTGFGNERLSEMARVYRDDGDNWMSSRLSSLSQKVGIGLDGFFESAGKFYKEENYQLSMVTYTSAFTSATPRHIPLMRKHIEFFLESCKKMENLNAALEICAKLKRKDFQDYEIIIHIVEFLAETRQPRSIIEEYFDIADAYVG